MTRPNNEIEQAVSRSLRDNLQNLQRSTEDLNHALSDLISACASSRPANALSPILRAQTAATSLASALEVLSRFVTASLQPAQASVPALAPMPQYAAAPVAPAAPAVAPPVQAQVEAPAVVPVAIEPPAIELPQVESPKSESVAFDPPAMERERSLEVHLQDPTALAPELSEPEEVPIHELDRTLQTIEAASASHQSGAAETPAIPGPLLEELPSAEPSAEPAAAASPAFDVSRLLPEQQELHRRANRVAKVSMQDIKMLRPEDVRLGQENRDICRRLRDDIEKAHKEYDRRFQAILDHPVDYFYNWMVEILGGGNPEALGEYPYSSPVLRR